MKIRLLLLAPLPIPLLACAKMERLSKRIKSVPMSIHSLAIIAWSACVAIGPAVSTELQWISFSADEAGSETRNEGRYFRKVFAVERDINEATLDIAADSAFTVWVNGAEVGQGNDAQRIYRFDVRQHLVRGDNVIAVAAKCAGGTSGLLVRLGYVADGRPRLAFVSESSWKASPKVEEVWRKVGFAEFGWSVVKMLGPYGRSGPRKNVLWDSCGVSSVDPREMELRKAVQLPSRLRDAGVAAVNISCGSPYYNPHIQRPAIFPPSDGYHPPEDPLVGVAGQIMATAKCKQAVPRLPMVGSGYSYLQDYLPHVAQAVVRAGWTDLVGLGRMMLSYPKLPTDCLTRGELVRKHICRTFSDCTNAPRNGMISGCFLLGAYYKALPEAAVLKC